MRTQRFSLALVLLAAPWFTLACASDPKSTTWVAPPAAPESSSVALHGRLKVVGTQLQDEAGAPIQLKGVSSMWLNWETIPYAESKPALMYMRDHWKLSVIRAAMGTDQSGGYLSNPAGMQAKVDQIVQNAIDLGVYVLVDWHTEKAVDQQHQAVEFFTAMATKYAAFPNVIWEPYNEPNGYTWAQIKPYHTAVVTAIRAVDPDNLIVLGTPHWSQDVDVAASDPVAGTNLLYTVHFYSCTHTQQYRDKGDIAIAAGLPLFVTEFGATYSDGGLATSTPAHDYVCEDEANLWFAWMAQNNISGVAWKLDQGSDASCILSSSAPIDGPWPDNMLSTDVGGTVSGAGIQGGHGLFVVNWIRQ